MVVENPEVVPMIGVFGVNLDACAGVLFARVLWESVFPVSYFKILDGDCQVRRIVFESTVNSDVGGVKLAV